MDWDKYNKYFAYLEKHGSTALENLRDLNKNNPENKEAISAVKSYEEIYQLRQEAEKEEPIEIIITGKNRPVRLTFTG